MNIEAEEVRSGKVRIYCDYCGGVWIIFKVEDISTEEWLPDILHIQFPPTVFKSSIDVTSNLSAFINNNPGCQIFIGGKLSI